MQLGRALKQPYTLIRFYTLGRWALRALLRFISAAQGLHQSFWKFWDPSSTPHNTDLGF